MVVLNNIVMYHTGIIRWTFIERDMNNSCVILSQGGEAGQDSDIVQTNPIVYFVLTDASVRTPTIL